MGIVRLVLPSFGFVFHLLLLLLTWVLSLRPQAEELYWIFYVIPFSPRSIKLCILVAQSQFSLLVDLCYLAHAFVCGTACTLSLLLLLLEIHFRMLVELVTCPPCVS